MSGGSLHELNHQCGDSRFVRFERDAHGMIRARVSTSRCRATIYLHGAHVTQFQPVGEQEMLFVSAASRFRANQPIRGGVPICFPWFAAKPGDDTAPAHGLARIREWDLLDVQPSDGDVRLRFGTTIQPFQVWLAVTFGESLDMKLTVENQSHGAQTFEAALHSYFHVADVRQVEIQGLESATYVDQLSNETCRAAGRPIQFVAETDRIYASEDRPIVLVDHGLQRRIVIDRRGSTTAVVWNPWIHKSQRMVDFGDQEWTSMCCIEAAAIRSAAIQLAAGQSHELTALHRISH